MGNNSLIVTALFGDRQSAECAYQAISSRGYDRDDVNVIMSDETRNSQYTDGDTELGSKALEGTATGAGIGGTLGALIGAIAAIGTSIVLPGLGLLVAGPLAGALVGAGAGGLTGGLIGALIGSGIPEEHAAEYEAGIKSGGTVLGVNPRSAEDAAYFEREFINCGGTNVYSSGSANTEASTARNVASTNTNTSTSQNVASTNTKTADVDRSTTTSGNVIPVIEEELQVGKREVEKGGVRVESHVTETPVEKTVNLREEHVTVERHPVNREVTNEDLGNFKEGEIALTERAEVPVVQKQARVVEEVEVGKNVTERQETVRDTVRRTDVEVEEIDTNVTNRTDKKTRKANS